MFDIQHTVVDPFRIIIHLKIRLERKVASDVDQDKTTGRS